MAEKNTRWRIEASSNIPEISKQIERLIQLQQEQNQLTQQSVGIATSSMQQQKALYDQLETSQTKSTNTTKEGAKQQSDAVGTIRKEYDLLTKQLTGLINLAAGAWAVGQLKQYVTEIIKAKSTQDGFVASMEQMLGSRIKAEELNAKLMEIATKSPFTVEQIQEVTKKLQGMGVETNKLIPYVNMLGDIASVVGTAKLPLIAKAMTDVQNKGVLMGQEIKQFTENGIPLFDLLAKSMNKPREEVVKLANDHKISFAEVEKALMQSTQKGGLYYGQMAVQAEQLGGKVANLGDKYTLALAKVGDFFEKGILRGINALGDLIDMTIGSSSAIDRLTKTFSAALTMWVAYRAAVLSTSAALKVNQVETLADLAAKEANAIATVGMGTASNGLKTSLTGLWTVMKANPWGALITVVTAAIGVYQLWGAAHTEVISALGEEEIKLKGQKQLFNDNVQSAMALKVGTDERRKAIEGLINKYPEYFRGMSTEGTNNALLGKILQSVNSVYQDRIDLARQAYTISKLEEKRTELLKEEAELMERIKKRSPELYAQVAGDSQKLMDAIHKGGIAFIVDLDQKGGALRNMWDNAMNGTILKSASSISKGLKDVDKEILASSQRRESINAKEQKSAIDAETQRWLAVSAQMKKGSKEYETAQSEHEDKVQQLSGKTKEFVFKKEEEKVAKKKTSMELSLENDMKELKSVEQTYSVKFKLLEAEEKLEIEKAKRTVTNAADLQKRIESIRWQYMAQREEFMRSEIDKMLDHGMKGVKAAEAASKKIIEVEEKKAEKINDITMFIEEMKIKSNEDDYKRSLKASDRLIDISRRAIDEMQKAEVYSVAENKKFWETKEGAVTRYWLKVKEAEIKGYLEERERLADHMAQQLKLFGPDSYQYKEGLGSYLINEQDLAKSEKEYDAFLNKNSENTKNWAQQVVKLFEQAFEGIYNSINDGLVQIESAYDGTINAYDRLRQANKKALDAMLSDTTKTYAEKEQIVKETLQREAAIVSDLRHLERLKDQNAKYMLELKDGFEETSKGFKAISSALNGDIGSTISNLVGMFTSMSRSWDKQQAEQEARSQKANVRMYENRIEFLQMQADAEYELLQQRFEMWDDELAAFEKLQNDKLIAAQEAIDKQKESEQTYSTDSQLRLLEDQNFRNQLLKQGEEREIANLNASRDRQVEAAIARGATQQEITDIINAFEALITQKHQEYADARGTKDKEVSLAVQEQKAQEADVLGTLEEKLNNEIKALKDELAAKEADVSSQKQQAQKEYAEYIKNTQGQIFEAEKNMAVAQIRVEIALLRSKRNIFNKGKINEAIGDLEEAINEIAASGNPYGYVVPPRVTQPRSNTNNTTPSTDTPAVDNTPVGDSASGSDRGGSVRNGGVRFHGDTWVELGNNPDGIDTVPLRLHKGERIMQTYLNQFLGPKVTNQELVHGYLQYANFMDRLPEPSIPNIGSLVLPDFSASQNSQISLDRVEKKLDELNKTFANKSLLNVNIDGNKVSVSEQWDQHKVNYFDTLFNK